MGNQEQIRESLRALAKRVRERRVPILAAWRAAVRQDPVLTTAPSLPRSKFLDHIPALLDAFELVLINWGLDTAEAASDREDIRAAQHGLERWRQGYQLFEVIREWRHLQIALVVEVESLSGEFPADAMAQARRLLAEMCADGVCESAERYFTLQRAEAQSRLTELEAALKNFEEVERQRAEAWREAAHDLRGNLGVVKTATAVLNADGVAEAARSKSLNILHRGVESMHELLDELISLARLEAGREVRQVEPFDAAALLAELCQNMAQVAESRGLELRFEGATSLAVRGDQMKVRRIAQNLLVNALTYTERGFVRLECAEAETGRWTLRVTDSGPGISDIDLVGARVHTSTGHEPVPVQDEELTATHSTPHGAAATRIALGAARASARSGEGIGLSIVKRLCELLDAAIELNTVVGSGSSFLVSFPKDYENAR
ncbi:MAG: HAMP domain-containing sensor histidine kinase [Burkholderiaceae bacterium]|jgi:signal transduction histidine kinase